MKLQGAEHIFKGFSASVRLTSGEVDRKSQKEGSFIFWPITQWDQSNSQYLLVFKFVYYNTWRLSEVCGLKGEDVNDNCFNVICSDERILKTHYSKYQILLHPQIYELMKEVRSSNGLTWPNLKTIDNKTKEVH